MKLLIEGFTESSPSHASPFPSHELLSLITYGGTPMAVYPTEKEFMNSFSRFNALSSPRHRWHTSTTENDLACEFGCNIPQDDLFFKKPLDVYGERSVHVCWGCMERMVYLTVDSDLHAMELTQHIKKQSHLHEHAVEKALVY